MTKTTDKVDCWHLRRFRIEIHIRHLEGTIDQTTDTLSWLWESGGNNALEKGKVLFPKYWCIFITARYRLKWKHTGSLREPRQCFLYFLLIAQFWVATEKIIRLLSHRWISSYVNKLQVLTARLPYPHLGSQNQAYIQCWWRFGTFVAIRWRLTLVSAHNSTIQGLIPLLLVSFSRCQSEKKSMLQCK